MTVAIDVAKLTDGGDHCRLKFQSIGAAAYAEDRFGIVIAVALRGRMQAFTEGVPLGEIDFSAVADALCRLRPHIATCAFKTYVHERLDHC